jgi:GNAT superfamily N-acetyltransferase
MEIRPLAEADLPAIRALLGQLIRQHAAAEPNVIRPLAELDPHANFGPPEDTLRLVAAQDGQVLGFAQGALEAAPPHPAFQPRRFFALYDLVVDPTFRRQGIATLLLDRCEAWARERGASEFELNVYAFNEEALAFYARRGYRTRSMRLVREL